MKNALLAVLALGSMASFGAASAADLIIESPPEPVYTDAFDWSGFQIGVQGVYFAGTADWQNTTIDERSASADLAGGALGVTASFDQAFGSIVVGVGAQYNFANISGNGDFEDGDDFFDVTVDGFGSVDGRVGIAMDRVMPYLTGGVAFAHASHTYLDTDDFGDDWFVGWDVGVGVQVAVTDNIIGNLSVRYADYGSMSYPPVGGNAAADHDLSLSAVLASAGLSIKF